MFLYGKIDFESYIRVKESRPSILSNFCMGGFVYKELGLEALSPTKNMFCLGQNYLEFLRNYEYYLSRDICEYQNFEYLVGTEGRESFFPKGIIDDKIIWYFNHDTQADTAVKKWNERRKKVNYDNIVAIMTLLNDDEAYEFQELKIERKIGIYYKDLGLKDIIYIPEWENPNVRSAKSYSFPILANAIMVNARGYMGRIDWIKFLNGEENYRRCEY